MIHAGLYYPTGSRKAVLNEKTGTNAEEGRKLEESEVKIWVMKIFGHLPRNIS